MTNKIVGGKILVIGDLHFSDVFTGKHKNYLENCMWVLGAITRKIEDMHPSAVVLGGDLIGWSETNIKNREILSFLCRELKNWNNICPVYSVRGNHDIKGYPDFLFLAELGLIITSEKCGGYFDYYGYEGQEVAECRFHIVDYGEENRHLDLAEGETSNIVFGHNNYTINGVTTWYSDHDGIELGNMQNFAGVDMVISGHIHNPSPEIYDTQMPDGTRCMLFYTGCPTRPIKDKNMYESCWFVKIGYNESTKQTDIDTEEFKLLPSSEIFYDDETFVNEKTEEEISEEVRKENLKEILDDILKYRISAGDPFTQIDNIPHGSEEAKKVAKDYLKIAFNNSRSA